MITEHDLENWFTYHSPTPAQQSKYLAIKVTAKIFAQIILENTPPSADQTAAIRKIREAVMTANAAIACDEGSIRQVHPMDIQIPPPKKPFV